MSDLLFCINCANCCGGPKVRINGGIVTVVEPKYIHCHGESSSIMEPMRYKTVKIVAKKPVTSTPVACRKFCGKND